MNVEIRATSAVKERIADTSFLDPIIPDTDRQPSWDGEILAYKNSNKKKSELFGRAPVQVKGKISKDFKSKTTTFRMSKDDLINYRNDGGVILFVVHVNEGKESKIFFQTMTPYYLNNLLEAHKNHKSVKISLKELPESNDDVCNMVFNFIRDMRRQTLIKNGKNLTIQEIEDLLGKDNIEYSFTYTGIGYDRNNPFSYLSKNDFYMYAQSKDKTVSFPIEHVEKVDTIFEDRIVLITTDDKCIEENLRFAQYEDKNIFSIGKSLQFELKNSKMHFTYSLKGNLNERIDALEILIGMIEHDGFKINGKWLDFKVDSKDKQCIDIDEKKKQLEYFCIVKETLDGLNVKDPLDVDMITDSQENNLRMIINAIHYNRLATFKEKEIPPVCHFDIGNLRILLHLSKVNDQEYKVDDFFNIKLHCYYDDKGEYMTSPYCILCAQDYIKASNLVIEKVIEDFKNYDNEVHLERLVLCVLELIKAYDLDNTKSEFLNYAIDLCQWLKEKNPENIIHTINEYQCYLRQRKLSTDELNVLSEIAIDNTDNNMILAGVNTLMGNKTLALKYVNKLCEEEKKEYLSYPIYSLLINGNGE